MNLKDFLEKLKEILESESQFTGDEKLSEVEEWDSLAALGVMALADKHGFVLSADELAECSTIKDVYQAAFGD